MQWWYSRAALCLPPIKPPPPPPPKIKVTRESLAATLKRAGSEPGRDLLRQLVADGGRDQASKLLGEVLGRTPLLGEAISDAALAAGEASTATEVAAGGAEVTRGVAFINDGKWIEAYNLFSAAGSASVPAAYGLLTICRLRLDDPPADVMRLASADATSPAERRHMYTAAACALAMEDLMARDAGADPHTTFARALFAFGHAVAYLLHADAHRGGGRPPEQLICLPTIEGIVAKRAAVLDQEAPRKGPRADPGASARRASDAEEAAWRAKAGKSEALKELLALTGLKKVKDTFFQIVDLVQHNRDIKKDVDMRLNALFYGNPGTVSPGSCCLWLKSGIFKTRILLSCMYALSLCAHSLCTYVSCMRSLFVSPLEVTPPLPCLPPRRFFFQGKTTVARIFAKLLQELGILPSEEAHTPAPAPAAPAPAAPAGPHIVMVPGPYGMVPVNVPAPQRAPAPAPAPQAPPAPTTCSYVETSGALLASSSSGGQKLLETELKKLEKGGVLFIDEAYQLKPSTSLKGEEALNLLLTEMERKRPQGAPLVVVFAGYKKQCEDLLTFNSGLPSRFAFEFTFEDYSQAELLKILLGTIAAEQPPVFRLEDEKHARIAATRLARRSGREGFGNARAVKNVYEAVKRRQAPRVIAEKGRGALPDPYLLKRDDLLGPREISVESSAALRELEGMVGLKTVKDAVAKLLGTTTSWTASTSRPLSLMPPPPSPFSTLQASSRRTPSLRSWSSRSLTCRSTRCSWDPPERARPQWPRSTARSCATSGCSPRATMSTRCPRTSSARSLASLWTRRAPF